MCSVQNFKVVTDQTRYNLQTVRSGVVGRYTVTIGKHLLTFRKSASPSSAAMSSLLFSSHRLLSTVVQLCLKSWAVCKSCCVIHLSDGRSTRMWPAGAHCILEGGHFIKLHMIYRTVKMPSWSAVPSAGTAGSVTQLAELISSLGMRVYRSEC
jgi:hypothetical protein